MREYTVRIGLALALLLLLGSSCNRFPEDPRHSLEQVLATDTLRVGIATNAPWVTGEPPGNPSGVETELITNFADDLGVTVDWHWGSEAELFEALKAYELDIVIGGITKANPWGRELAFTMPYYTGHVLVGVPPASPMISDLDGVTIAVHPTSGLRHQLADEGATVVSQEPLAAAQQPVAAEEWEITGMGFHPTTIQLDTYSHVMAVPRGENALLMRLEEFLLHQTNETAIARQLWEVAN